MTVVQISSTRNLDWLLCGTTEKLYCQEIKILSPDHPLWTTPDAAVKDMYSASEQDSLFSTCYLKSVTEGTLSIVRDLQGTLRDTEVGQV